MKLLKLDFSDLKQRKRNQSNWVLVILLLIVAVGILFEYSQVESQAAEIEDTVARVQGPKSVKQAEPTEQDMRQMKVASVVLRKLNFPWHELLETVERVKKKVVAINLMNIQPNPEKEEVLIKAEAPNLRSMLAFVSLLEEQPTLSNVLLINQHNTGKSVSQSLAFTLKMDWKVK